MANWTVHFAILTKSKRGEKTQRTGETRSYDVNAVDKDAAIHSAMAKFQASFRRPERGGPASLITAELKPGD